MQADLPLKSGHSFGRNFIDLTDADNLKKIYTRFKITPDQTTKAKCFFADRMQKQSKDFSKFQNGLITLENSINTINIAEAISTNLYRQCSYFTTKKPISTLEIPFYAPELFSGPGLSQSLGKSFETPDVLLGLGQNRYVLAHVNVLIGCEFFTLAVRDLNSKTNRLDDKDLKDNLDMETKQQQQFLLEKSKIKEKTLANEKANQIKITPPPTPLATIECGFLTEPSELHLSLFLKIITFFYTNQIKLASADIRTLCELSVHFKSKKLNYIINNLKTTIQNDELKSLTYEKNKLRKRVNFKIFKDPFPDNRKEDPIEKYLIARFNNSGGDDEHDQDSKEKNERNMIGVLGLEKASEEFEDLVAVVDKFLTDA